MFRPLVTSVVSALAFTSSVMAAANNSVYNTTLSVSAQDYFDYTMSIGDERFDPSYGYIWYLDNGEWSTRFTSWYIPGLLYRNQGDDLANAEKALRNL